jgi:regulator of replication initiation timing
MSRKVFITLFMLNSLALVGALAWFYYEPKFEPIVATIGLLVALFSLIVEWSKDKEDHHHELSEQIKELAREVRGLRTNNIEKQVSALNGTAERTSDSVETLKRHVGKLSEEREELIKEIRRLRQSLLTTPSRPFPENQKRLLALIAKTSDLELQQQLLNQHRLGLANIANQLFSIASTADEELAAVRSRIVQLQEADKLLEMYMNNIDSQREAVQGEINAVKRIIGRNIENSFKLMNDPKQAELLPETQENISDVESNGTK